MVLEGMERAGRSEEGGAMAQRRVSPTFPAPDPGGKGLGAPVLSSTPLPAHSVRGRVRKRASNARNDCRARTKASYSRNLSRPARLFQSSVHNTEEIGGGGA